MILLTPGPCMTSESVRQASALPDMNHRDPAFRDLVLETRQRLLAVYPETGIWHPYLLGGSGTAAVEAMVTSCVQAGPVLVIENGYYSGRIAMILSIHGIPHDCLAFNWETGIDVDQVRTTIAQKAYEAVLLTHNETTLGILNPIEVIAEICWDRGVRVLVDAMSSFGADPIRFDHLDAVCASANKCLHGLPGVSFVLVRPELAVEIRDFPRRSYYLSLPMYEGEDPPLTPPVPSLMAFREALRELPGGNWIARHGRYAAQSKLVRGGLAEIGLACFESESRSCTLASVRLPQGFSFERLFGACYDRDFVIYGCKAHLREQYFQVSWMGEITNDHLHGWLRVMTDIVGRK